MNVYILTIDGNRDAYINALDATPMVRNWLAFLPTAVAVVSERSLAELSQYLRTALPFSQFIMTPATAKTSAGLLPGNVWEFINNPKDSGRHQPDYLSPLLTRPPYSGGLIPPLSGLPPVERPSEKNSLNALLGEYGLKNDKK